MGCGDGVIDIGSGEMCEVSSDCSDGLTCEGCQCTGCGDGVIGSGDDVLSRIRDCSYGIFVCGLPMRSQSDLPVLHFNLLQLLFQSPPIVPTAGATEPPAPFCGDGEVNGDEMCDHNAEQVPNYGCIQWSFLC